MALSLPCLLSHHMSWTFLVWRKRVRGETKKPPLQGSSPSRSLQALPHPPRQWPLLSGQLVSFWGLRWQANTNNGLRRHTFIISQLWTSEVWAGLLSFQKLLPHSHATLSSILPNKNTNIPIEISKTQSHYTIFICPECNPRLLSPWRTQKISPCWRILLALLPEQISWQWDILNLSSADYIFISWLSLNIFPLIMGFWFGSSYLSEFKVLFYSLLASLFLMRNLQLFKFLFFCKLCLLSKGSQGFFPLSLVFLAVPWCGFLKIYLFWGSVSFINLSLWQIWESLSRYRFSFFLRLPLSSSFSVTLFISLWESNDMKDLFKLSHRLLKLYSCF